MKGITPVIAIVLLLMITVAMVGFAFVWFQGALTTVTDAGTTQIDQGTETIQTMMELGKVAEGTTAGDGKIYVENTGIVDVKQTRVNLYDNLDNLLTCTWYSATGVALGSNDIPSFETVYCVPSQDISSCTSILLRHPSGTDSVNC